MKLQNHQAESHKTENIRKYLAVLLDWTTKISDTRMLKILPIKSLNTIRRIRIRLVESGILRRTNDKMSNNEKLYEIINRQKAHRLFNECSEIIKSKNPVFHETNVSYFKKWKPFVRISYQSKNLKRKSHLYPLRLYKANVCPVCQGSLINMKFSSYNELDRRCSKCKMLFLGSEQILAFDKPLRLKKPIRVDPWNSYNSPVRQLIVNKIAGKILKDM